MLFSNASSESPKHPELIGNNKAAQLPIAANGEVVTDINTLQAQSFGTSVTEAAQGQQKHRLENPIAALKLVNAKKFVANSKDHLPTVMCSTLAADAYIERGQYNLLSEVKTLNYFKANRNANHFKVSEDTLRAVERRFRLPRKSLGDRCSLAMLAEYWTDCYHEVRGIKGNISPDSFFDKGFSLAAKPNGGVMESFKLELRFNLTLLNAQLESAVLPMVEQIETRTSTADAETAKTPLRSVSKSELLAAGFLIADNFNFNANCWTHRREPGASVVHVVNGEARYEIDRLSDYLSHCRGTLNAQLGHRSHHLSEKFLNNENIPYSARANGVKSFPTQAILDEVEKNYHILNQLNGIKFATPVVHTEHSAALAIKPEDRAAFEKRQRIVAPLILRSAGMQLSDDDLNMFGAWQTQCGHGATDGALPLHALDRFFETAESRFQLEELKGKRTIGATTLARHHIPFCSAEGEVRTLLSTAEVKEQLHFNRAILRALIKASDALETSPTTDDLCRVWKVFGRRPDAAPQLRDLLSRWLSNFEIEDLPGISEGLISASFVKTYLMYVSNLSTAISACGIDTLSAARASMLCFPHGGVDEGRVRYSVARLAGVAQSCLEAVERERASLEPEEKFLEPLKRENPLVNEYALDPDGATASDYVRWHVKHAPALERAFAAWVTSHGVSAPRTMEGGEIRYPQRLMTLFLASASATLTELGAGGSVVCGRNWLVQHCIPTEPVETNVSGLSRAVGAVKEIYDSFRAIEIARREVNECDSLPEKDISFDALRRYRIIGESPNEFVEAFNVFRARAGLELVAESAASVSSRHLEAYYKYAIEVLQTAKERSSVPQSELLENGIWTSSMGEDRIRFFKPRLVAELGRIALFVNAIADGKSPYRPNHASSDGSEEVHAERFGEMHQDFALPVTPWRSNDAITAASLDRTQEWVEFESLPDKLAILRPDVPVFHQWLNSYGVSFGDNRAPVAVINMWLNESIATIKDLKAEGSLRIGMKECHSNYIPMFQSATTLASEIEANISLAYFLVNASAQARTALREAAVDGFAQAHTDSDYARARVGLNDLFWSSFNRWYGEARRDPEPSDTVRDIRLVRAYLNYNLELSERLMAAGNGTMSPAQLDGYRAYFAKVDNIILRARISQIWQSNDAKLRKLDQVETLKAHRHHGPSRSSPRPDLAPRIEKKPKHHHRSSLAAKMVELNPDATTEMLFKDFWRMRGRSFPEDWGQDGRNVSQSARAGLGFSADVQAESEEPSVESPVENLLDDMAENGESGGFEANAEKERSGNHEKASARFYRKAGDMEATDPESPPVASAEERKIVWELVGRFKKQLKNATYNVNRTMPTSVDVNDQFQDGVFAMIDALYGYNPNAGKSFEQYLYTRLRGGILDGIRETDEVPRLTRVRTQEFKKAVKAFRAEHGYSPNLEDLAEHTGKTIEHWRKVYADQARASISLQREFVSDKSNKSQRLADLIQYSGLDAIDTMSDQQKTALELINLIPHQNLRLVLHSYYIEGLTMKEAGERMDLSESRVSQLHTKAIELLKERVAYEYQPKTPVVRYYTWDEVAELEAEIALARMVNIPPVVIEAPKAIEHVDKTPSKKVQNPQRTTVQINPPVKERAKRASHTSSETIPGKSREELRVSARNYPMKEVAELFRGAAESYSTYPTHVNQFLAWFRQIVQIVPNDCSDLELLAAVPDRAAPRYLAYLSSQNYKLNSVTVKFAAMRKACELLPDADTNKPSPWRNSDIKAAQLKRTDDAEAVSAAQINSFLNVCLSNRSKSHVFVTSAALVSVAAASQLRSSPLLALPSDSIELDADGRPVRILNEHRGSSRNFTDGEAEAVTEYLHWRNRLLANHEKSPKTTRSLWLTSDCEPLNTRTANRTVDRVREIAPELDGVSLRTVRRVKN